MRPAHGVAAEWGSGNEQDFALACEIVGNKILEVNGDAVYKEYSVILSLIQSFTFQKLHTSSQ